MRERPSRWTLALALLALSAGTACAAEPELRPFLLPRPIAAAAPFVMSPDAPARAEALNCLASAVYYEAANQPLDGRRAVAQVVLNRVRHPIYPKSVCGVVYQGAERPGCQFTFACDGSLARIPFAPAWREALAVADDALNGFVAVDVGASTHYHTLAVHPAWDGGLVPTLQIGAHQFYRFSGDRGQPSALTGRYSGVEPALGPPSSAAVGPRVSPRLARILLRPRTAAARPAQFSVWGLGVDRLTPERDGAVLIEAGGAS